MLPLIQPQTLPFSSGGNLELSSPWEVDPCRFWRSRHHWTQGPVRRCFHGFWMTATHVEYLLMFPVFWLVQLTREQFPLFMSQEAEHIPGLSWSRPFCDNAILFKVFWAPGAGTKGIILSAFLFCSSCPFPGCRLSWGGAYLALCAVNVLSVEIWSPNSPFHHSKPAFWDLLPFVFKRGNVWPCYSSKDKLHFKI